MWHQTHSGASGTEAANLPPVTQRQVGPAGCLWYPAHAERGQMPLEMTGSPGLALCVPPARTHGMPHEGPLSR